MRVLCIAVISLLSRGATHSTEWPQFRGPNASGVAASDASPPVEFGPAKGLLWKQNLPAGHSSPTIWGDHVYVTGFDAESKKLELICLSAKTGTIVWRKAAAANEIEATHVVSNPATASPALDANRVYAYFSSYGVTAFSHAGVLEWTMSLPMPKTHHGSGASPILAGDLLIINHDAMQGGYLLAINRRTGKQAWKQSYPAERSRVESYSTPIVWHDDLILHRAGVIEAYRISNGERRWLMAASTSGLSTAIAGNGMIYVSTWNNLGEDDQRPALPSFSELVKRYDKDGDGAISETEFPKDLKFTARPELDAVPNSQNYATFKHLDRDQDGLLKEQEWEGFRTMVAGMTQDHGLVAIRPDGDTAAVVWKEKTSIPEVPSPLLYKGRLFLIRNGGIVTCLDAATGAVIYRGRAGAPGPYFASPVAAAGHVYFASADGVVTVIAGDKEQLQVLAKNDLGEEIIATPALAGNAIYIRTRQKLYAFGKSE